MNTPSKCKCKCAAKIKRLQAKLDAAREELKRLTAAVQRLMDKDAKERSLDAIGAWVARREERELKAKAKGGKND